MNEFTVGTAATIARLAHHGQFYSVADHSIPYVVHPAAVYGLLAGSGGPYADDPIAQMLAWLHDVVEDTWVTLDALRDAGAPEELLLDLDAISKRSNEPKDAYWSRVMERPRAWAVKVYDVQYNSRPESLSRVAEVDPMRAERMARKYARAREVLGDGPPPILESA